MALLTAAMAFMTEKGPRFHAKVGRVYGGAMVGVGLTAVILWAAWSDRVPVVHRILLHLSGPLRLEDGAEQVADPSMDRTVR